MVAFRSILGLGALVVALPSASVVGCGGSTENAAPDASGGRSAGGSSSSEAGQPPEGAGGKSAHDPVAGAGGEPVEYVGGAAGETSAGSAGAGGAFTTGGAVGTEAGTGGEAPASDPCDGVSARGECLSASLGRRCVTPTGNGSPMLVSVQCQAFEECVTNEQGARCVVKADACAPGTSECDGRALRTCDSTGQWRAETCFNNCEASSAGAFCTAAVAYRDYTGKLGYDAVRVNADFTDWAETPEPLPASGVLVVSLHGEAPVGVTTVEADGSFTVKVAENLSEDDRLAFLLLHPTPGGSTVDVGVFDPNVRTGTVLTRSIRSGTPWQWVAPVQDFPDGSMIHITEDMGSGALHLFRQLLQASSFQTNLLGRTPRSVVAWLRLNTEWDCGACFLPLRTEVSGYRFDAQLFFSATQLDRAYWSEAVAVHELGHFTMWAYGHGPDEGGTHCVGVATLPGQAWSEGWATGFSSIARSNSVYYDKQEGSMFWLDLERRRYSEERWRRPRPAAGLLQNMDENEVAAMLWRFATGTPGAQVVLQGLRAPEVLNPPFGRGYTRHEWDVDDDCSPLELEDTGESVPMFADYLDGLRCSGVSAAEIDAVTNPETAYPYPSDAPLCER